MNRNFRRTIQLVACVAVLIAAAGQVQAGLITVSSYDIDRGRASGFGGWSNIYSGTITSNGDGTSQFSGGSGTLNDGILPSSVGNSQLYFLADVSVTHLHLGGGVFNVNTIDLFGFNNNNYIPGNISSVEVTINGISGTFTPTGFGTLNSSTGLPINQQVDLSSSALSGLSTSEVDLRVLSVNAAVYPNYYQIGEVTVSGRLAAVPEPCTLAIWSLLGVCGMGIGWRRRKQTA